MNSRWKFLFFGGLIFLVLAVGLLVSVLRRSEKRRAKVQQQSEEQARRELTQAIVANPGDPRVKAKLFWASDTMDSTLVPVTVELPLSNDPVLRSKQVLNTLLAGPVDAESRTLPPDALLLAFYLLPDGTGVADFSEALATSVPSGIVSEQLAVNSITRTLEANVPQVQRLKILIHGQEMETLAGHLDLTEAFIVRTGNPLATPAPVATSPAGATPPAASDMKASTPAAAPDKPPAQVAQPAGKP